MIGRRGLMIVVLLLIPSLAQAVPRMRICTADGMVTGTRKIFLGSAAVFFAAPVDPDDPATRFRRERALADVTWRLFRTRDLHSPAHLVPVPGRGREVAHIPAPRPAWGRSPAPFAVPEHLDELWSAGRYELEATHPIHGTTRIRITVATLLLLDHEAERTTDSYRASARVALADPDRDGPSVPLELEVVDAAGRTIDRAVGVRLVRDGLAHVSPRPFRLSSETPEADAASRRDGPGEAWPVLRVVPDSRLRVIVGDRVLQFPIPFEEGLLVRRSGTVPFGREGAVLENSRVGARGLRNQTGRGVKRSPRSSCRHLGSGDRIRRPEHVGRVPGSGDGKTYRSPRRGARGDEAIEIHSDAGRGRRLKLWLGETATFAARLRPRGLDDLFRPGDWLRDVGWTLHRVAIPTDRRAIAIIPGTSISLVGRLDAHGLWGDPPSLFVCPDDVHGRWRPGLYILRADRGGGPVAEVRLDVAAFELVDVETDLRKGHYVMSTRFRLTDPLETRDRLPIGVRIVGARGEVHDEIRGVVLSRDLSRRDEFLSIRVRLSSKVARPCMDRYEGKDPLRPASLPGTLKVVPGSRLRIVLGDAVFSYPLPLTVHEVLTGRSGASDRPGGD